LQFALNFLSKKCHRIVWLYLAVVFLYSYYNKLWTVYRIFWLNTLKLLHLDLLHSLVDKKGDRKNHSLNPSIVIFVYCWIRKDNLHLCLYLFGCLFTRFWLWTSYEAPIFCLNFYFFFTTLEIAFLPFIDRLLCIFPTLFEHPNIL
jgi:hypothetical protein